MATDYYGNIIQGATQGAQAPAGTNSVVQGATGLFGGNAGAAAGAQAMAPQMTYSDTYTPGAGRYGNQWGVLASPGGGVSYSNSPAAVAGGAPFSGSSAVANGGVTSTGAPGVMSPDQMRAATNSLVPYVSPNSTGGGALGAGGGNGTSGTIGSGGALQSNNGVPSNVSASGANGLTLGGAPSDITPQTSYPVANPNSGYQPPTAQSQAVPAGNTAMQATSPQDALSGFQGSAANQLLGSGAGAHYQQSPGYQFAVNDALRQTQATGAAQGLMGSGSLMRSITDRAQGMASQDYNNWWNQQNTLFNNYQNSLAGLAGGDVGASNAMTNGTNQAAISQQTGSNLGSLFGNQGNAGLSGIANTGAAQANNITQAGDATAQINAANQATQLAGAVTQYQQPQQTVQRSGLF